MLVTVISFSYHHRKVRTYVAQRRQELVNEVSVSTVDLNDIKASLNRTLGSLSKLLDKPLDLMGGQFLGMSVVLVEGNRTGANHVLWPSASALIGHGLVRSATNPRRESARLAAGVANLNGSLDALAVDEVGDSAQRSDLGVLPQARVLGGDAAAGLNGGGFDKDEARAVERQLAEMHQVVVGQVAVVGAVLAHGRHDDAVVQLDGAHAQRREESRRRCFVYRSAGGRVLGGSVEGHSRRGSVLQVAAGADAAHFAGCVVLLIRRTVLDFFGSRDVSVYGRQNAESLLKRRRCVDEVMYRCYRRRKRCVLLG